DGRVPPTINLDDLDPECQGVDHVREARPAPLRAALTNSFGFGGHNAALVVAGPPEGGTAPTPNAWSSPAWGWSAPSALGGTRPGRRRSRAGRARDRSPVSTPRTCRSGSPAR